MARPKKKRPVTVTIYQSSYDGMFHGHITVGRKPNGTPDVRHRTGKTYDECADKIRILEDKQAAGTLGKAGRKPTVRGFFTAWLTDIAPHQPASQRRKPLRPRTLDDYWSKCHNWIFPNLGELRLDELERDPTPLDAMYAKMYKAALASSTVLKVHAILRRGLSLAQQRGLVTVNVAAVRDNPGSPATRKAALSEEQTHKVLAVIEGRPRARRLRWKVGLAIGPRQGEALGIRWRYLDLDEGVVDTAWQIQRRTWRHGCDDQHACGYAARKKRPKGLHRRAATRCPGTGAKHDRYHKRGCPTPPQPCPPGCVKHAASCPQRHGGGLVFTRPKTMDDDDAEHLVALPPSLVEELKAHRLLQVEDRLAAGELWVDHDLVFCGGLGQPIDPHDDWEDWRGILAEAGIEEGGTHIVRHTAATMMLELGVDIAVVQEVLGHSDIRTTGGYQRVRVGLTRRAAKAMDRGFFARNTTDLATRRRKKAADAGGS